MGKSQSKTILVVDDDETINKNIVRYLEDAGFVVLSASNGIDAIETIKHHHVDLTLLDFCMPGMSGLEVLHSIKKTAAYVQVVMLSDNIDVQDVVQAMRLGAYDYIGKPTTDMKILDDCVAKAVSRELIPSADFTDSPSSGSGLEDLGSDNWLGKQLGNYKVLQLLGRGAWGAVYRAQHYLLETTVALKILSPAFRHSGKSASSRFLREARHLAHLSHPNIVEFYDIDIDKKSGCYFITMEYIKGHTLAQIIEERTLCRQLTDIEEIVNIGIELCSALEAIHDYGIVHRDIKPQNIMITKDFQVKLMDFGLATSLDPSSSLTMPGEMLGTPLYVAPESFMDLPWDVRSDLYSLGITLFCLLTNNPPFLGDNPVVISLKHMRSPIPDLHAQRADIPLDLEQTVKKLLAKKPKDRFQNAKDVAAALRNVSTGKIFSPTSPVKASEITEDFAFRATTRDAEKVKVMVVDDSVLMAKALCKSVAATNIEVIATARNGEEALRHLESLTPDVITMDINMPIMDGITVLKHIMAKHPCRVIMVSGFTYEGAISSLECLAYGAVDFIWKSTLSERVQFSQEVVKKIRKAACLQTITSPKPRVIKSRNYKTTQRLIVSQKPQWLAIVVAGDGGLSSHLKILPHIPKTIPCAIVILQEVSRDLLPIFVEYINCYSKIRVKAIEEGETLQRGVCYIATDARALSLAISSNGQIHLHLQTDIAPADTFCETLKSAARAFGDKTIGIALSGNCKNAVDGLLAIKQMGGMVIVQKPENCLDPGISQAAITRQIADQAALDIDMHSLLWHLLKQKGAMDSSN